MIANRNIITALLLMAVLAMASCGSSIDQMLVGTWRLSKSLIPNLDSVVKVRSQEYTSSLTSALKMVENQLDSCNNASIRANLEAERADLRKRIEEVSPENIKRLFEEQQKLMEDDMLMIFGSDKVLSVFIGNGNEDNNSGTWQLSGDTIKTLFDNNPSETLLIRSISKGSLVIESFAIDATGVNLILEFKRD